MLKNRSILIGILLNFITFGLYSFFWIIKISNDFARNNNKPTFGGFSLFLTIITFGLYAFIWVYKISQEIEFSGGNNEGVLYIILLIFLTPGLTICAALMQAQENQLLFIKNNKY